MLFSISIHLLKHLSWVDSIFLQYKCFEKTVTNIKKFHTGVWSNILLAFLTLFLQASRSSLLFSSIFLSLMMFLISPSRNLVRGETMPSFPALMYSFSNSPSLKQKLWAWATSHVVGWWVVWNNHQESKLYLGLICIYIPIYVGVGWLSEGCYSSVYPLPSPVYSEHNFLILVCSVIK